ncbi:MAG TPA: c-type cytochrome, partial [Gammaproteobacteria bacterium]|nr:c-type cytochrome [Gammaproteobacteria bacterium]
MSMTNTWRKLAAAVPVLLASHALAFTAEQSAAGRAAYEQSCVVCHGANLRQLPGSLLAGPEFVTKWGERGIDELVATMRATMPPDRPGALPEEQYVGLAAYILQTNGGTASA